MFLTSSPTPPTEALKSTILYHGTTGSIVRNVLADGLLSRSRTGRASNYDSVTDGSLTSHKEFVYLGTKNALSHALFVAYDDNDRTKKYAPAMVVKVLFERLDQTTFYPDEDYLRDEARRLKLPETNLPDPQFREIARNAVKAHKEFWVDSLVNGNHPGISVLHVVPVSAIAAISLVHIDALLTDCFRVPPQKDGSGGIQFRRFANVASKLQDQVENALLAYVWGTPISAENAKAILEFKKQTEAAHVGAAQWEGELDQMRAQSAFVFDPNSEDKTQQEKALAELSL